MKCQSLFSGKNINLSSVDFAHSVVRVKALGSDMASVESFTGLKRK